MKLSFYIYGNQEDKTGNAIPKAKLTKGQQWTHSAQRYAAWKEYVRAAALEAMMGNVPYWVLRNIRPGGKLFPDTVVKEARLDLIITWANEKHGDPESIFGSIADALFENDKHLSGSFTWIHGKAGMVEVSLSIVTKHDLHR